MQSRHSDQFSSVESQFDQCFPAANEICDRFATAGFNANLITYLTQQLHLPLVEASNTLTNFGGTSAMTPILGALAADSFAGRFWTIIAGSVFYQLGMLGLVLSAAVPSLRPPPCAGADACRRPSGGQLAVVYVGAAQDQQLAQAHGLRQELTQRHKRERAAH